MKRIIFLLLFTITTLIGCSIDNTKLQNAELEETLNSMLSDENIGEIDFNSVVDFDWDKAHIFQPYTSQDHINEKLGFKFNDPSDIDIRDDIYLLVFIHDNQVVHYVELRNLRSISDSELSPSDAILPLYNYIQ